MYHFNFIVCVQKGNKLIGNTFCNQNKTICKYMFILGQITNLNLVLIVMDYWATRHTNCTTRQTNELSWCNVTKHSPNVKSTNPETLIDRANQGGPLAWRVKSSVWPLGSGFIILRARAQLNSPHTSHAHLQRVLNLSLSDGHRVF